MASTDKTQKQRGYGYGHKKLRKSLAPRVNAGLMDCARCGERIEKGQPWDLGHNDERTGYRGPEHESCNRATMGRERAVITPDPVDTTREW